MKRGSYFKKGRKAVSPVIATVLLIGMVIVLGSILFLWLKGFTQEAVTKFDKNVELVCNDVQFQATYSGDGTLGISNVGNVPIYDIKVKITDGGNFETMDIKDLSENWKSSGLNPGRTFSGNVNSYVVNADSITLIPVLVGSSASGEKSFPCDEASSGYKIDL